MIDRLFDLTSNQTTIRRELLGGVTTFLTMAYIIVVNAQILSQAGIPADGVVFATCIASAVATLVMGLYANYPIALAPGMSLNAYFAYTVCIAMHVPWRTALGAVFLSGVLFVLLTVTRVREQIVNGIPRGLKHATAGGIGMFIAFVGLRSAKLVVANPATFVSLGSFADPQVQAACLGLVLTLILMVRRVNGSILLGILGTTLFGIFRGLAHWPSSFLAWPNPSATFLQLDIKGALHLGLVEIIFIFLFVDLFDNVGTMVGVCEQGGFIKDGKIPRVGRALLADGIGTIFGALTGTSTVTSYIESAAGAYRAEQHDGRRIVSRGHVLLARSSGNSRIRHCSGADSCGRIDDRVHRTSRVEGIQRSLPRLRHADRHAADLQHRHRPQPGRDFLHNLQTCRGETPRSQPAALAADHTFHCAVCIFSGRVTST